MKPMRTAMLALLFGAAGPTGLPAPVFAQTCECPPVYGAPSGAGYSVGGPIVYADEPPPPLPDYEQPPIPGSGYYWTPGYWAWNTVDYYWAPGAWVEPPEPGLLWTPG